MIEKIARIVAVEFGKVLRPVNLHAEGGSIPLFVIRSPKVALAIDRGDQGEDRQGDERGALPKGAQGGHQVAMASRRRR